MTDNMEMRLARLEAMANHQKSDFMEVLEGAYHRAVEAQDEEGAAEFARRIRNKLLDGSDKYATLDKLLPDAPSGSGITDWIAWLKQLADIRKNAWSTYRQHLRDITTQEGFPFNIDWGKAPDAEDVQEI